MVPFDPAEAVMVKVVAVTGENVAVTLLATDIVVVQVPVPVHTPVQPANV